MKFFPAVKVLCPLLLIGVGTWAQPDTLVLNQTEFRFPETFPGEVFIIKKVLTRPEALKKESSGGTLSTAPLRQKTLIERDVMGRTHRERNYEAKLAKIRRDHVLPTYASRSEGRLKPLKHVSTEWMGNRGRFDLVSSSPLIRGPKDLVRMEREERASVRRKHGALSPDFAKELESKSGMDSLDVHISLVVENPGFLDPRKVSLEEQKAHAKKWAQAKPINRKDDLMRRYGLKSHPHNPVEKTNTRSFIARVPKSKITDMALDPAIAAIERYTEPNLLAVPGSSPGQYIDLVRSAENPHSDMIYLGYGNVATLEMGLTDSFVGKLHPSERPDHYHRYVDDFKEHSEATYHILALGSPGAGLFHFKNGYYGTYEGILDTLVNHEISAISQSYIRYWWATPTESDSRFVDRMSYIYPYTTFSMPACNAGHEYVPCCQSYNILSVGNVQHYDRTSFNVDFWVWDNATSSLEIVGDTEILNQATQTTNPSPIYGSVADREMPYIVAPGWTPDPWWGFSDSTIPWEPGPGGTSYSAPVLAAMAGNLKGALGYSWEQPLIARAALLATAENVDGGYWDPYSADQRDGAGTVSGANAVRFVLGEGPYGTSYNPGPDNSGDPQISAIDVEYLDSSLFGTSQYFYYRTPSSLPSGKHLRVVLTWNSSPGLNVAQNAVSDLGLAVQTGNGWYVSDTWNSNIEMIDIPNSDLASNTTYQIRVDPTIFRKADDGPDFTYYALAWTWVKDHAD